MVTVDEVDAFLTDVKLKMSIWNVLFLNRQKNTQTLVDLEISPNHRVKVLGELVYSDYSDGPTEDIAFGESVMWVFGKRVKGQEIYIKITMGNPSLS